MLILVIGVVALVVWVVKSQLYTKIKEDTVVINFAPYLTNGYDRGILKKEIPSKDGLRTAYQFEPSYNKDKKEKPEIQTIAIPNNLTRKRIRTDGIKEIWCCPHDLQTIPRELKGKIRGIMQDMAIDNREKQIITDLMKNSDATLYDLFQKMQKGELSAEFLQKLQDFLIQHYSDKKELDKKEDEDK